ncbi:paeninodin family lasso peptide [Paenibacillus sp. PR3]|uniref:Paeninodin family lasso peptide n=1 Tax=Paenibacillus terricola TaxID=2763503 RepID=A0ABR8MZ17_9BACL|nr:paeninodin family lasso peptide [Paenibacillus terricola]MBD3921182.1 paeninodin family lasso peptide [Paenibacillus terricola]
MSNQTLKQWQAPVLETLDVKMTAGGPNGVVPDKNGKGANNRHDEGPGPTIS